MITRKSRIEPRDVIALLLWPVVARSLMMWSFAVVNCYSKLLRRCCLLLHIIGFCNVDCCPYNDNSPYSQLLSLHRCWLVVGYGLLHPLAAAGYGLPSLCGAAYIGCDCYCLLNFSNLFFSKPYSYML